MPTINLKQPHHAPESKHCYKCGKKLPLASFAKSMGMLDGVSNECKDCTNQRKLREKAAREARANDLNEGRVKSCPKCNKPTPFTDYDFDACMCKLCVKKNRPLTESEKVRKYLGKGRRRR